jgi:probable addiction module antidote protein
MKSVKEMGTFRDFVIEHVKDPERAEGYLRAAVEQYAECKDLEALLLALQTITVARGVGFLAKKSGVSRKNLYTILSGKRSPDRKTMEAFFRGLGYNIPFTPTEVKVH